MIQPALESWAAREAPGWINLLVLVSLWNALKLLVTGTSRSLLRVRAN